MYSQSSFGGYQLSNKEEERQNQSNPLLTTLGVGAAGAGIGFGIDTERRRRAKDGPSTRLDAAKESAKDFKTALDVLLGQSDFDKALTNRDRNSRGKLRQYVSSPSNNSEFLNLRTSTKEKPIYVNNPLTQTAISMRDAFMPSGEDFIQAQRAINERRGLNAEGPRAELATKRIPLFDAISDLTDQKTLTIPGTNISRTFNNFDQIERSVREERGLNLLKSNVPQAIGSAIGRTGSELVNNGVRGLWWLLNAPQAVSDVVSESATARPNRDGIYGAEYMLRPEAYRRGLIDNEGKPREGSDLSVSTINPQKLDEEPNLKLARHYQQLRAEEGNKRPVGTKDTIYRRRRASNNYSTLLALPAAIGINAGLGLTNALGGSDGRKAALPSEDDPTKTRNVIMEVANKYILGRQGDILAWDEFKKVRPDVTKDEYMAYKAYRYSKGLDLNPLDGDFNIGGILKGDDDGIFGPEMMFLGKSMPYLTTLLPTGAAIGGASLGAALGQMGSYNADGIEDRLHEADFEASRLERIKEESGLNKAQENRLSELGKRRSQLENRANMMQRVPGYSRMRKVNPIASSVIGGFGALAAGTVLGTELERRRREQKVAENAQRNHFNGMDAGL